MEWKILSVNRWKAYLKKTSLADEVLQISVRRGCPEGEVLSPLVCYCVFDELFVYSVFDNQLFDQLFTTCHGSSLPVSKKRSKNDQTTIIHGKRSENKQKGGVIKVNPAKTTFVPLMTKKMEDLKPLTIKQ